MERRTPPHPGDLRLSDARDWHLEARCGCGRTSPLPIRLLAGRHPRHVTVGRIARRLRCVACGAAPGGISRTDGSNDGQDGSTEGPWFSVPLLAADHVRLAVGVSDHAAAKQQRASARTTAPAGRAAR